MFSAEELIQIVPTQCLSIRLIEWHRREIELLLDQLLTDPTAGEESIVKRERCSVRQINRTISPGARKAWQHSTK